jgi:hypothetical protein
MQCNQFERILEQQDAGPLPGPALAHIDVCDGCRGLVADFDAISEVAIGLDAEGIAPPEHIWISLRSQLEAEGIIHAPDFTAQGISIGWWTVLQRPALAGAFLTLVLIAATLIGYRDNSTQVALHPQTAFAQETSTVPSADTVFKEELLNVSNDSVPGPQGQDAAVTDSIHRNLGIVDNFIAMCEKSVREQPDNAMAREYLYGAYQQKAELLATAMNRGTMGGLQ